MATRSTGLAASREPVRFKHGLLVNSNRFAGGVDVLNEG